MTIDKEFREKISKIKMTYAALLLFYKFLDTLIIISLVSLFLIFFFEFRFNELLELELFLFIFIFLLLYIPSVLRRLQEIKFFSYLDHTYRREGELLTIKDNIEYVDSNPVVERLVEDATKDLKSLDYGNLLDRTMLIRKISALSFSILLLTTMVSEVSIYVPFAVGREKFAQIFGEKEKNSFKNNTVNYEQNVMKTVFSDIYKGGELPNCINCNTVNQPFLGIDGEIYGKVEDVEVEGKEIEYKLKYRVGGEIEVKNDRSRSKLIKYAAFSSTQVKRENEQIPMDMRGVVGEYFKEILEE